MLKENLIQDYQIFFDLRDKYPEHSKIIAEVMKYAFENHDSFYSQTYLNGRFNENNVKFIFASLNLPLTVSKVFHTIVRNTFYTIVEISLNEQNLS